MRVLASLTLRSRFLVLVLLGAVAPLGLAGFWLAASARRSGETLVQQRLEQSLAGLVDAVGKRWTVQRSTLLDFGDARAVHTALRTGRRLGEEADAEALAALETLWWKAAPIVAGMTIRDTAGRVVADLPTDLALETPAPLHDLHGVLLHRLNVFTQWPGEWLGTMEMAIRVRSLLPPTAGALGVSGAMLILRDVQNGTPLMPLAIEEALLSQERFTWEGDTWLLVEHRIDQPPLHIALAGPAGAIALPLSEATRRGTLVLAAVAVAAFTLVALFAHRLTRTMSQLSRSAESVASGDLAERVRESGPPEVVRTAQAFNAMTESLRHTLQRLSQQEAVAAVGEFAASLAHEVRNPLSSIRVDLQRSRRKLNADPGEAGELVDRALGEIDRLNQSVSNFLRIARSGNVSFARVDLRMPLEAAVRAAAPRFDVMGASLEYLPPEAPVWVAADPGALEQLVLNLLLNAADVSGKGKHTVLRLEMRRGDVLVSVSDEGPGIAPRDATRVFEPFFSTKRDGTGLGLSVARRIALAHGSELEVESSPGHGATFSFVLPVTSAPSATVRSAKRDGDATP
jgi:signal transduction histidine kinase